MSIFINDIGLYFSFFVVSLSHFVITVTVASKNELGSFPSSAIFWNRIRRIDINSSLSV